MVTNALGVSDIVGGGFDAVKQVYTQPKLEHEARRICSREARRKPVQNARSCASGKGNCVYVLEQVVGCANFGAWRVAR